MVHKPLRILFVCSGNIFRSVSAEYLLQDYVLSHSEYPISVRSAGITAKKQDMHSSLQHAFAQDSIDVSSHKQRKLSEEILSEADLVICMGLNHESFILTHFMSHAHKVILFNEIVKHERSGVLDIEERVTDLTPEHIEEHVLGTYAYIKENLAELHSFCEKRIFLFEDFIIGKKVHTNGLPFIVLQENDLALSFMSKDIPCGKRAHVLVIPKKRHQLLEDIPLETMNHMMSLVKEIGEVLKKEYPGYNILLNNGSAAGQFIKHAHIHIIPREFDDSIAIETWKRQEISPQAFIEFNDMLQRNLFK